MRLGTFAERNRRVEKAEEYGFSRKLFPWSYNGHDVVIMDNDGYIEEDGKLFLKLALFCRGCNEISAQRGKLDIDEHLQHRLQTIKLIVLHPYHLNECV
jgi:hypothetical protein